MDIPIYTKGINQDLYQDDLNQTLQDGLSDNGWTVPQLTTTEITTIAPDMPNGSIWYDTDAHEFKGLKNGSVVTFTTS